MPAPVCPHCGAANKTVICQSCGGTVPYVSPSRPESVPPAPRPWLRALVVLAVLGILVVGAVVLLG